MAKLKTPIEYIQGFSKKTGIPKSITIRDVKYGILPVLFKWKYIKKIVEFYNDLTAWIDSHGRTPEMDIEITAHYRDGNQKQKALAWVLYEIMADVQNGGQVGSLSQMITPMQLYRQNLRDWAQAFPADVLYIPRENIRFHRDYRIIEIKDNRITDRDTWIDIDTVEGKQYLSTIKTGTKITIRGYWGMSKMDKRQLAKHIEGIFHQLAEMDIPVRTSEDLKNYLYEYREWKQEKKIGEDPELCTREEYRRRHLICEACPKPPHDLAHIRAVGMGGDRSAETMVDPLNTLHLCREDHNLQHARGWGAFKKKYPHLRDKINAALRGSPDNLGKEKL